MFDADKENCLNKLAEHDKSRAGSVDESIVDSVNRINSLNNYYTTSSCAGRLIILEETENRNKNSVSWVYCSHEIVQERSVFDAILNSNKDNLWMHMEYPIMHICARSIEDANILLSTAEMCGLRHCGIIALNKKIIIEIIAQERLDIPIAFGGDFLLKEIALGYLVNLYNKKIEKSREKINKFSLLLKKDCK
ncbi:MAG: tRNA wybutosine-synthesizing 3 family protein [archaeon]